jgi:hypothetical protein
MTRHGHGGSGYSCRHAVREMRERGREGVREMREIDREIERETHTERERERERYINRFGKLDADVQEWMNGQACACARSCTKST